MRFRWLVVLSMRFLYGIRNLTALWLGTQKYPSLRYLLLNLIGGLIWISIWFLIFFLFRTLALQYYQSYIHTIRYLYLAALGVFLLWKLKKLIIDP
ncbi:MAG: hypothetical protein P8184_21375 [Calditrichia bacterium]